MELWNCRRFLSLVAAGCCWRADCFSRELPRRESLILYGGQGVRLALGIIPLLLVAGTLEGFFSPSYLPVAAKFACSIAAGGLLVLYLTMGGRKKVPPGQSR